MRSPGFPPLVLASSQDQPTGVETSQPGMGVPAQVVVQSTPNQRGPSSSNPVGEAWLWIGVLIVVTVVGGLGLMWYRRSLLAASQAETSEGFMESIRRLRASGEMSEEEFQAVRRNLIASIRAGEDGFAKRDPDRKSQRDNRSEKF